MRSIAITIQLEIDPKLTEYILKFALHGAEQMWVITARPIADGLQAAVARVEHLDDLRPFFFLVERTQNRQAGSVLSVPTARSVNIQHNKTYLIARSEVVSAKNVSCKNM